MQPDDFIMHTVHMTTNRVGHERQNKVARVLTAITRAASSQARGRPAVLAADGEAVSHDALGWSGTAGSHEDGYLVGLDSLIRLFEKIDCKTYSYSVLRSSRIPRKIRKNL